MSYSVYGVRGPKRGTLGNGGDNSSSGSSSKAGWIIAGLATVAGVGIAVAAARGSRPAQTPLRGSGCNCGR